MLVRVLQPHGRASFTSGCGAGFFGDGHLFSRGRESDPHAADAAGQIDGRGAPAGLFGHNHLLDGFAGGQAEPTRVPYAAA